MRCSLLSVTFPTFGLEIAGNHFLPTNWKKWNPLTSTISPFIWDNFLLFNWHRIMFGTDGCKRCTWIFRCLSYPLWFLGRINQWFDSKRRVIYANLSLIGDIIVKCGMQHYSFINDWRRWTPFVFPISAMATDPRNCLKVDNIKNKNWVRSFLHYFCL